MDAQVRGLTVWLWVGAIIANVVAIKMDWHCLGMLGGIVILFLVIQWFAAIANN